MEFRGMKANLMTDGNFWLVEEVMCKLRVWRNNGTHQYWYLKNDNFQLTYIVRRGVKQYERQNFISRRRQL